MSASETGAPLRTLQIGMEWFPDIPGGVNRLFYELALRLPTHGCAVRGLVAGPPGVSAESHGLVEGVAPVTAPLPVRWARFRRAIRTALKHDPGALLATHFALYAVAGLDAMRGHPLVVHFHGPWAQESRDEGAGRCSAGIRAAIERTVYGRGTRHIVLSAAFGAILRDAYRVPESRIRIVPGGVDVARFAAGPRGAAARESLGWPGDRFIILAVRRLVRRMGLENLLDAMSLLRRRHPQVLLLVAGAGPLAGELRCRIREAGLEETVRLLDRLPDDRLVLAYRAADLTVVPSVALEGFGLIVPESLAAGTPVLVTPVGGLPEAVGDLSPELVLAGTAPEALAEGLAEAILGQRRLPDAPTCTAFARARYDWPIVCEKTIEVYREARG